MHVALIILNLIASAASAAFAFNALAAPGSLSGSRLVGEGEVFYVRMYAARTIPLAFAAGLLPFWYGGAPVSSVLLTAALIQGADIFIAVKKRKVSMVVGASVGVIIHGMCALAIRSG